MKSTTLRSMPPVPMLDVLKSLDTLLKPGDVVSDALSSFPLELVRGKEHLEAFTLLLWSLLSKLCFKPCHQGFNASAISCQPCVPNCQ